MEDNEAIQNTEVMLSVDIGQKQLREKMVCKLNKDITRGMLKLYGRISRERERERYCNNQEEKEEEAVANIEKTGAM